jgi:hypothetical protein
MGAVDFRSRHFAFRGAALSLLVAASPAGSQLCRCIPAGVYVPCTAINRFSKLDCNLALERRQVNDTSILNNNIKK